MQGLQGAVSLSLVEKRPGGMVRPGGLVISVFRPTGPEPAHLNRDLLGEFREWTAKKAAGRTQGQFLAVPPQHPDLIPTLTTYRAPQASGTFHDVDDVDDDPPSALVPRFKR